jgi:hypothetical protein
VVREEGIYKAMLYDPDANKVIVASAGESIGEGMVERVTATGADIRDRSGLHSMTLIRERSGG